MHSRDVTIIIPTSIIPSHPDTTIIDETIRLKKNSNCFLISNRIIYNNKFKKVGYSLYKVN